MRPGWARLRDDPVTLIDPIAVSVLDFAVFSFEWTGLLAAALVTGALTAAVVTAKILAGSGRPAEELTVGPDGVEN